MPGPRNRSMLELAARLYYLDGKSQAEVADAIGVTRSNVSRVLADARRLGIVEVRVHSSLARVRDLENRIMNRFSVRECYVAEASPHSPALPLVGEIGAAWLQDNKPVEGAIAVSWGASVQAVIDATPQSSRTSRVEVLPLVGGVSRVESTRDGNVLVRALAAKLGGSHRRLYAPAVVESKETRDTLVDEPSIGDVLRAARGASIALVGVGSIGGGATQAITETMNLSPLETAAFLAAGPVGDCCTRFFDRNGAPVDSIANDRVIAIELADLRQIATVVGVAAGRAKAPGYAAALRGDLIDVAMIDQELAEALLATTAY